VFVQTLILGRGESSQVGPSESKHSRVALCIREHVEQTAQAIYVIQDALERVR